MKPPLEKEIQKAILKELNKPKHKLTIWRNNSGTIFKPRYIRLSPIGTPDLIGFNSSGTFIAIEVKRNHKCKVSPEQLQWLNKAKACGVICGVATSVEEALKIIKGTK